MTVPETPLTDAICAEFGEFNAPPFITLSRSFERDLARQGWKPIETAPKDGTRIDVWSIDGLRPHRETDVFWGKPGHCCGENEGYCDDDWHRLKPGWVDSFDMSMKGMKLTHWRPIPGGPDSAQGTERATTCRVESGVAA